MQFRSQGQDTSCIPVAIHNAAIYLNITPPDNELPCETGSAIGADKFIEDFFQGSMVKCNEYDEFVKTGGILTINHPIFNFHAICAFPDDNGLMLVNSWLGPNVIKNIGIGELERFLPPYKHQCWFWRFKDGIC